MSAANGNKLSAPRQVACVTSDNDEIPVDLDVLRLSGTFKDMCDDLGLEEHEVFEGVFPVKTVSSRIFKKVIDWCKEHKDDPELVVEKDPLTRECKWLTLADFDKTFFDVPVQELLELVKAASFLDIPRLYHYACQSIAACIKGKSPGEIGEILLRNCDLVDAQIRKTIDDNPWLECPGALSSASIENPAFIPNEVLVSIFEKLPREDIERMQLVSTQFSDVIMGSSELSEHQGPLRVVDEVYWGGTTALVPYAPHSRKRIGLQLREDDWGTVVNCPDFENLAKRLKFSTVQKLSVGYDGNSAAIQTLSALLPVKSAWRNATVETSMQCFFCEALFEFLFIQLLLCKEIILDNSSLSMRKRRPLAWSRRYLRLPAFAECNKLDLNGLLHLELGPGDVVEWLKHETSPENKRSEPREIIVNELGVSDGGIDELHTALETAFPASGGPKPYVVRFLEDIRDTNGYTDDYWQYYDSCRGVSITLLASE